MLVGAGEKSSREQPGKYLIVHGCILCHQRWYKRTHNVEGDRVHQQHPTRLTSAEYVDQQIHLCLYLHTLQQPIALHWHEFYEVGFVLDGQGTHVLNGRASPLRKGSLFLLTPADFHELHPDPGESLHLYDMVFSFDALKEEVYCLLFTDPREYSTSCTELEYVKIEAEFQRLWQEFHTAQIGRQWIVQGALERILIDLMRLCITKQPTLKQEAPTQRHQRLRMGLIYMHHHFRGNLTLQEVAQQVHLSPYYFSESFHQAYGISFQKYLQNLRLHFAFSLLSTATLSITEVCYASGFNTLSHFERTFKQQFGHAPGLSHSNKRNNDQ